MASVMATAIVTICASTSAQYNPACQKALDAGTRQAGYRQLADSTEDRTIQNINAQFKEIAPTPMQNVVGVMGIAYKTAKERKLAFKLPNMGVCDTLTNEISPRAYNIAMNWKF